MISSQEALEIIINHKLDFGTEKVSLSQSYGRVLKEPVFADRDFPPFDRVMMDGIAINHAAIKLEQTKFPIEGIQAAGSAQKSLQIQEHCYEVMTGAVLPNNTDTVIPYEKISITDGVVSLQLTDIKLGQHIHRKGTDQKKGNILIKENMQISGAEMGILATVGHFEVCVAKAPKILIVSTGDELIQVGQKPATHQLRRSNVYSLVGLLKAQHIHADEIHLTDNKKELSDKFEHLLNQYDVILCSGAVSMGKFDFLPEVFKELGVKQLFHKVAQRPGKPFWFGRKNHCSVFAFPGNPVSTYVGCLYYFNAWLSKSTGINQKENYAMLNEQFSFSPKLTYFLQVKLSNKTGTILATPLSGKGSGDLANLALADGFMILPPNKEHFHKGENYPIISYR